MTNKITIDQILEWGPCKGYDTAKEIISKTDNNWPKTPLEIADLAIPISDRLWVLLRPEIIPDSDLHLLACDFAEMVLSIYEERCPCDDRPRHAIETMRRWVYGEVTTEKLKIARDATIHAASNATCAIALSVATAAAYSANCDAAWVSAWDTAWKAYCAAPMAKTQKKQLKLVKKILQKLGGQNDTDTY